MCLSDVFIDRTASNEFAVVPVTMACETLNCTVGCRTDYVRRTDSAGCETCDCYSPCSSLVCPENTQCELLRVPCLETLCPLRPVCRGVLIPQATSLSLGESNGGSLTVLVGTDN
ncbi:hypothetical protein LSAT2_009943 [Lamellibrachia satsuma]|nr:hypothetical protein LSAT2_009943 [Lamellibrachia satsuma]